MLDLDDVHLLLDAFVERQGLSASRAQRIVDRLGKADDEIARAAVYWARTGEMPSEPAISGYTPAALSGRLSPSQVFTGLVALRENPSAAEDLIRHPPAPPAATRAREWEERVGKELVRLLGDARVRKEPLGPDGRSRPDFLIDAEGRTVIVEAKLPSAHRARLRSAVEQVERLVLVFGAAGGLVVVPELVASAETLPAGYLASVRVVDLASLHRALDDLVASA